MLNLYYRPTCPYCLRVLKANQAIGVKLNLLDISSGEAYRTELITKGGKQQVPFLEDTERGVCLYESIDIIEYLKKYYGNGVDVKWDEVGNVCPIE